MRSASRLALLLVASVALVLGLRVALGPPIVVETPVIALVFIVDRLSSFILLLGGVTGVAVALDGGAIGRRSLAIVSLTGAALFAVAGDSAMMVLGWAILLLASGLDRGPAPKLKVVALLAGAAGIAMVTAGVLSWAGLRGPASPPATWQALLIGVGALFMTIGASLGAGTRGGSAAMSQVVAPLTAVFVLLRFLLPFDTDVVVGLGLALVGTSVAAVAAVVSLRLPDPDRALSATAVSQSSLSFAVLAAGLALTHLRDGGALPAIVVAGLAFAVLPALGRAMRTVEPLSMMYGPRIVAMMTLTGLPPFGAFAALVALLAALISVAPVGGVVTGVPMLVCTLLASLSIACTVVRWRPLHTRDDSRAPDPGRAPRAWLILAGASLVAGLVPGVVWGILPGLEGSPLAFSTGLGVLQPLPIYVLGVVLVAVLLVVSPRGRSLETP